MRLYRTGSGRWHGTQADARADAGRDFLPVDVPTDKPGLLAWLNTQHQPIEISGRDELVVDPAVVAAIAASPAPAASTPPDTASAVVARDLAVEDEIAQADLPRTIRLCEHVHWRLKEHLEMARAR